MSVYGLEGHSCQRIGGECPGGWIKMDDERPSLNHVANHDGTWGLSAELIEAARAAAYADPVQGSDRFFAKAARLEAMGGDPAEIEKARIDGATRFAEIQAAFPYP